jgi:hypothetical protein
MKKSLSRSLFSTILLLPHFPLSFSSSLSPPLIMADEKKKPAPVGVANVERRTWNEQEYEEKAAARDEEVRIY